ncbi:MAG: efflux RND transporter permease subunit [bacterium]|nr:efflux RND transporter permease subunit [bacterium]
MSFLDICINRPVLTLMMTLSLIVFGVMGYLQLGVDQLPNMEFPVVTVTATLEGATPEVMEEDVTEVLEEFINTIDGLRTLKSTTFHGVSRVVAEFELERDIDQATQDVRDKLSRARFQLPPALDPPVIEKVNFADQPIIWLPVNSERPATEVTEYLRYTVKPYLETVQGIASTELFGRRNREIRIWVDGDALRARGLSAMDVVTALRREHVEVPGGRVESQSVEYTLRTDAEFETVEALAAMVIASVDGAAVRLKDVARVEDGAEDRRFVARFNGGAGAGIGILKQPRANTVQIAQATHDRIDDLREYLPSGITFANRDSVIDFSLSILEAVNETLFALQVGSLLAILTVLLFLRRMRPTLIVSAAIPLSLITTFGFLWLFGFTLNTMTLLGLTLAVGVVIDDAIVVLENIERHREAGEAPKEAASKGARQIAFAATAATLSIAVVFLPVVFVDGIVGSFLGEFGLTVAAAVMVSLFVALTLTPMLAARMAPPEERAHGSFYHRLEVGFLWLERRYTKILHWSLAHRGSVLAIGLASFLMTCGMGYKLDVEFFPPSDEGRLFVMMDTPPGTSLDGTMERVKLAEKWMLQQPEVNGLFAGIGVSGPDGPGDVTNAVFVAILKPRAERERTSMEIMEAARDALKNIPGLNSRVFDPSSMFSAGGGEFEFSILANLEIDELDELTDRVVHRLEERPGFVGLHKSLRMGLPEIRVTPDREKAAAMGVDARSIATVVQASIGGIDIGKFKEAGHRYDIRMRLEEGTRNDPESIGQLYVRNREGKVVELRNLVSVETGAAPSTITRHNRRRSVSISSSLEGIPVSEAIEEVTAIAREILPEQVEIDFSGSAEAFQESISQFMLAIGLAILIIYMVLAAQFESLLHPLTVMLALPLAMFGALGGLLAAGMSINLFSLIGIILLFGLVTKNSILLVDFANQLREEGMDKVEAMRTAAPVRMRPVLMTAFSMIFGVLPAAIGVGPGSETRAPMAVATGAGMFSSTILTLLMVPVFYIVLDDLSEWIRTRVRRLLGREPKDGGPAAKQPTEPSSEAIARTG